MRVVLMLFIVFFVVSCVDLPFDKPGLSETELQFELGKDRLEEEDYDLAILHFMNVKDDSVNTELSALASKKIDSIVTIRENLVKEKEERLKEIFSNIKEETKIQESGLIFEFSNIKIGDSWIANRYDDSYRYHTAERGMKYLSSTLRITSDSKEPTLPAILLYKVQQGKLILVKNLRYQFFRWRDYGAYLGNYQDKNNDFRYSEKVTFTVGVEIDEKDLKEETLLLVLSHGNYCYHRVTSVFDRPAVSYSGEYCSFYKEVDPEELGSLYTVIKMFNKKLLE